MNPRPLNMVAYVFMASGCFALIGYLGDLFFSEHAHFDPSILDLWIGRWLMEREPRGYRLAIFLSVLSMILAPASLVLVAMIGIVPSVQIVGVEIAQRSWPAFELMTLAWTLLNACQFHVLRRPHIRALFPDSAESNSRTT